MNKNDTDIRIVKGNIKYLADCAEALVNSDLGRIYFSSNIEDCKPVIIEGFERDTVYVAMNGGECVGFMYYLPGGAFHNFPYLHILAVKVSYRNMGIGTKMLAFLENLLFETTDKLFLVTSGAAPIRFYERNGYQRCGEIASLYREGIDEYIFMKKK